MAPFRNGGLAVTIASTWERIMNDRTEAPSPSLDNAEIGKRVQVLRKRCGLSLRRLATKAEVTPSMISLIERGKTSPSITMLQKLLTALGSDLTTFFSEEGEGGDGPVFHRQHMRTISDGDRTYTIVFPKRKRIAVEMFDEQIAPNKKRPPFETLKCDVGGYILSGSLTLEIRGGEKETLRPGDAFYVPKGCEHRGFAATEETVRLIAVYYPAKY
jgi:transcriptional regulator with XRE-family HTH domain